MIKKRLITVATLVAMAFSANAQVYKHNIDAAVGGGLHSNQFSPERGGDNDPRFGWLLNGMYRHMLNQHWGLGGGLSLFFYKSKANYDDLLLSNQYVHPGNGWTYEDKATFDGWVESQRLLDLEFPVAAYYTTPINEKWSFLGDLGVKLMIPVWNRYHVNDGELEITGFFKDDTNIEYYDLPQHGFTTYRHFYGESDIKPVTGAGFIDAGVLRKLKNNMSLYLGAYFSYSFTNLSKEKEDALYNRGDYTGIVSSNLVDNTHLLATGVKVGLSWGYPKVEEPDSTLEVDPELLPLPGEVEKLPADTLADTLAVGNGGELDSLNAGNNNANADSLNNGGNDDAARMAELERARQDSINKANAVADTAQIVLSDDKEEQMEQVQTSIERLNTHLKVNFDFDKAIVEPNADNDRHIMVLVQFIHENPERIITVHGHTCDMGNDEYNYDLGMRRAQALRDIMVEAGIPARNLKVDSKGSKEPIAPNDTEENRAKNRRVELTIE